MGLFARALAEVPDGGRFVARVEAAGKAAVMSVEHTPGVPDPDLIHYTEAARAAAKGLGGEFAQERKSDGVRLSLALPKVERA
jgi:hypothetical protein